MIESPELRWLFIRKVYTILSIQLLLTIGVGALVVIVHPISHFFVATIAVLLLLYSCYDTHPWNYIVLGLFTVSLAFAVGLACSFTSGKIILVAVILTAVVVVGLTLYTFWAVRRGHDFHFLGPFLFGALTVLTVFSLIQIFLPLGKLRVMIYGCLASIIFCGYIIYDTNNLIEKYTYDQYIWAAVALYLDVINLFLALFNILRDSD